MISMIAIIGKNRELGKDNKLIWNVPEDLKRFRQITAGHPVIMGRKTFISIGRLLPNRVNIIVTNDSQYHVDGAMVVTSLDAAIEKAHAAPGNEEIFIIGGGTIYTQAINLADRLYLTVVDESAEADTYFPDYSNFTKVIHSEKVEGGSVPFSYLTLEK